jgi:hypothetical protein
MKFWTSLKSRLKKIDWLFFAERFYASPTAALWLYEHWRRKEK